MSNLTNTSIQDTYGGILNIGAAGLTGALQQVTDGFGNPLPFEVNSTEIAFTGTVSGLIGNTGPAGPTGATGPQGATGPAGGGGGGGLVNGTGTSSLKNDDSLVTTPANASSACSIAIGNGAITCEPGDIAIGNGAIANGTFNGSSISIGNGCAQMFRAINIGFDNHWTINTSLTVGGCNNFGPASDNIVIGYLQSGNINNGEQWVTHIGTQKSCLMGKHLTTVGSCTNNISCHSTLIGHCLDGCLRVGITEVGFNHTSNSDCSTIIGYGNTIGAGLTGAAIIGTGITASTPNATHVNNLVSFGDVILNGDLVAPLTENNIWVGGTAGTNIEVPISSISVAGPTGATGPQGATGADGAGGLVNGTGTSSLKNADALVTTPANASSACSIAIGNGAIACDPGDVAIGNGAIAIGEPDLSLGGSAISIGNGCAQRGRSINIGYDNSRAFNTSVTVGGCNTFQPGSNNVIIGYNNGGSGEPQFNTHIGTQQNCITGKCVTTIGNCISRINAANTAIGACLNACDRVGVTLIGFAHTSDSACSTIIGYCNTIGASLAGAAIIGTGLTAEKAATTHVNHLIAFGQAASKFHDNGNSASDFDISWDNGNNQEINLVTNIDSLTLSNGIAGANYSLKLVQGGSGGYTITWPASVKWAGGTGPVLSTGIGDVDIVTLLNDGTNYYGAAAYDFS
jgi:hypothetical protein